MVATLNLPPVTALLAAKAVVFVLHLPFWTGPPVSWDAAERLLVVAQLPMTSLTSN